MTTSTKRLSWTVPLAGFANPRYVAADPTDATGFDISGVAAYAFAIEGTGVATIVHEQTLDDTGVAGWFPVVGKAVNSSNGTISATMATAGVGYIVPALGVRARMRVTALATADLVTRIALMREYIDLATTGVLGAGSSVIGALAAGTALIGAVSAGVSATVGAAAFTARIKSAASTNATLVLTGARKLFGFQVFNTTAAKKYLKLYNKATAPVVGTDVPIATIEIPPNGSASYSSTVGKAFSLGLCYAITGLLADADTTAVAVDDVTGHLDFV